MNVCVCVRAHVRAWCVSTCVCISVEKFTAWTSKALELRNLDAISHKHSAVNSADTSFLYFIQPFHKIKFN